MITNGQTLRLLTTMAGTPISVTIEGEETYGVDRARLRWQHTHGEPDALVVEIVHPDGESEAFLVEEAVRVTSTVTVGKKEKGLGDGRRVTIEQLVAPFGTLLVTCVEGTLPEGVAVKQATISARPDGVNLQAGGRIFSFPDATLTKKEDSAVVVVTTPEVIDYTYVLTTASGDMFELVQKRKYCCGGRIGCK